MVSNQRIQSATVHDDSLSSSSSSSTAIRFHCGYDIHVSLLFFSYPHPRRRRHDCPHQIRIGPMARYLGGRYKSAVPVRLL